MVCHVRGVGPMSTKVSTICRRILQAYAIVISSNTKKDKYFVTYGNRTDFLGERG